MAKRSMNVGMAAAVALAASLGLPFGHKKPLLQTREKYPPNYGKHSKPPYRRDRETARLKRQMERDAARRGAFEVGEPVATIRWDRDWFPLAYGTVLGCSRRWVTVELDVGGTERWPVSETFAD